MKAERIVVGILAHVDAGKTTLAESILFKTGSIRKAGRVDHKDAYLDTHALEKDRGITIFSKQAQLDLDGIPVTLMDTPGHVDFSAEMERTLQVLDYAILVISGADGVQGHVLTLWRLLKQYNIPVFLFVNKMDQPGTDRDKLLHELKNTLDLNCVCFNMEQDALQEELAGCDEALMEQFFEGEEITVEQTASLIRERKVFPCFFGSALKITGVDEFLDGLHTYLTYPEYPDAFSARVFKIAREGNTRLTYLKVTGGTLKVKQVIGEDKADQVRLPSGASFQMLPEAGAGTVCAVSGLTKTFAGQGLGEASQGEHPVLEPVLTYALILPEGTDVHQAWLKLSALEEEIPEMHLAWDEHHGEIKICVMGEIQIEILKVLILERFGLEVTFGAGRILYRETIANVVEGVGHYEPLRHYAEVHLVMQPGERGSGVTFESLCKTDDLDLNWQRLIMTHLEEKQHLGVLTGSPITDIHIMLTAGRAHLKHTEGGDFRQSTYRAIRQGLMQARSILLEPMYRFRMEIPTGMVGRAMSDIQSMCGTFEGPFAEGDVSVLTGTAPVACMRDYPMQVQAYTGGSGRILCSPAGYMPCHNTEEVIAEIGYDADADMDNPSGSVFCSHGAGMFVPWHMVPAYMHLPGVLTGKDAVENLPFLYNDYDASAWEAESEPEINQTVPTARNRYERPADIGDDAELLEIFNRTYGSLDRKKSGWEGKSRRGSSVVTRNYISEGSSRNYRGKEKTKEQILLVDGYNIIFDWEELRDLAVDNLDGARMKLMEILSNYQGFRQMTLILVFDAYKVTGGKEENYKYHNIYVVYTKEAETADAYIERSVHKMSKDYSVTVATSDGAEQIIIWGQGANRMSARELKEEVAAACRQIQQEYLKEHPFGKRYLFENLDSDMAALLEMVRLGKAELK